MGVGKDYISNSARRGRYKCLKYFTSFLRVFGSKSDASSVAAQMEDGRDMAKRV